VSYCETQHERPEVLVVPHHAIELFFRQPTFICDPDSIQTVLRSIFDEGKFVDRKWAEENPSVKQVVAYGVVRHQQRVLCLRRSRNTKRDSLRLRYTLLVGGHVDDLEKTSPNPLETCLIRELEEVIGLIPKDMPLLIGIAVDPTTKVGEFHMGVVFDVPIESAVVDVPRNLDNAEFVNASGRNRYELEPIDAVMNRQFDSWSALFLASEACKRIFGRGAPDRFQRRHPLFWGN
jgi:predicted NUDIX family phosphoesterase